MISWKQRLKNIPVIGPLLVGFKKALMSLRPGYVYLYTIKPFIAERIIVLLRTMIDVHALSITRKSAVVDTGTARFFWEPRNAYSLLGYPLRGTFEEAETAVAVEIARSASVIIDVGANFGWYACHFLASLPEKGELHLFEPAPSILEQLKNNLDLNRRTGVRTVLNEMCLSDAKGETTLHVPIKEGEAFASILPQNIYGSSMEIQRSTTTLDAYCREHNLQKVDFLKIDVEGAELKVLRGAEQLLSSPVQPTILIESQDYTVRAFGYSVTDVITYIQRFGYRGYVFAVTTGALLPLTDQSIGAGYNYLFLGRGTPVAEAIIQRHIAEGQRGK